MPLDIPRQAFIIQAIADAPLGAEVIGLDLSLPLGALQIHGCRLALSRPFQALERVTVRRWGMQR